MTAYASTATTIVASVVAKLRLEATADATRTLEWVNQTLCNVAVKTRCISGSAAGAALTAAAASQALPAAVIELEYITAAYGGQSIVMREVTFEQLLRLRQQVSSALAAGPPWVYALRLSTVEFWPAAVGGEVLTYYGATMPDALTNNAPPAPIVEPYASKLLEAGACVEAAVFKKDPLLGNYEAEYAKWLADFQVFLNRRGGRRPLQFQVDAGTRQFVPHDPSSDLALSVSPWL